jgi:hypothetical protein
VSSIPGNLGLRRAAQGLRGVNAGLLLIAAGVIAALILSIGGVRQEGWAAGAVLGIAGLALEIAGKVACLAVRDQTRSAGLLVASIVLGAANFVVCLADLYVVWHGRLAALLVLGPLNLLLEGASSLLFLVFLERLADVVDNPMLAEKVRRTRERLIWLGGACVLALGVGVVAPPVAIVATSLAPLPIVLYADLIARFRRAALRSLAAESGEPVGGPGL